MQKIIDLSSPAETDCEESDSPSTTASVDKLKHSLKGEIARRRSKRLEEINRWKTGSLVAKAYSSTPKPKTTKKKKKTSCNSKSAKKKRTSHNSSSSDNTNPSTPLATAATAISVPTGTTPLATTTINIHTIPAVASVLPVAQAYYVRAQRPTSRDTRGTRDRTMLAFHEELCGLTERIALNSDNHSLDTSECACKSCPYSTGKLGLQRYNMMVRTFQINSVVSRNEHLRDDMW